MAFIGDPWPTNNPGIFAQAASLRQRRIASLVRFD
jgi:hypothetical protein